MTAHIDAEGVAEKAAHLRACGWYQAQGDGGFLWHHPELPALPGLTLTAAFEIAQAAASIGPERRDPAQPPRRH